MTSSDPRERRSRKQVDFKHPEHDEMLKTVDRVGQVWEDGDGWVFFVVGSPVVIAYDSDGRPFQFEHGVYVLQENGTPSEWPLTETTHRPLEFSRHKRLY